VYPPVENTTAATPGGCRTSQRRRRLFRPDEEESVALAESSEATGRMVTSSMVRMMLSSNLRV
jgi:hypothetical protein